MFEALGHEITTLKRLQIGQIKLEKLPTGMWRFLKDNEILYLVKSKTTSQTTKKPIKKRDKQ
jgi:16S rRNA U516 pseudouridylate synthase RsuA-like enzyme